MSGVNVARLLKLEGVTENVLILEANDYVGGRLCPKSLLDGKVIIDIGGRLLFNFKNGLKCFALHH